MYDPLVQASQFDELVARAVSTVDGKLLAFEDAWQRRVAQPFAEDVTIALPCIEDLILTKKFGARPRDADDVRWLERLRESKS